MIPEMLPHTAAFMRSNSQNALRLLECRASMNVNTGESRIHGYTRRMPLLLDGKLTIPLYHGTNLLFYDSIKEYGLGGRNPLAELRVIVLLKELIAISEESLAADEDWILRMQCAKFIASQEVTGGGFNFRHGSAYLAASLEKAVRYAISSEFSSEALAQFMMLWKRLRDSHVTLPPNVANGSRPIVELASGRKAPLVIQVSDVAISSLTAEDGGDPIASLNRIEPLASGENYVYEALLGDANFELHQPISVDNAMTFRVIREPSSDSAYSEGYSLVLSRGESSFDGPIGEVVHKISLP
jgi:hypothetical protein